MTRAVALLLICCLAVLGGTLASVLGRGSYAAVPKADLLRVAAVPVAVTSAQEGKRDRLDIVSEKPVLQAIAPEPSPVSDAAPVTDQLRQAFAATTPTELTKALAPTAKVLPPVMVTAPQPRPAAQPRVPQQKSYTLLSDAQIAAIKSRLRLSPMQENHWPGVETALRAIARKMHERKQVNPATPIDVEGPEVEQLKMAAMPLLFALREDQKREVRALARVIGLEAVAARI